MAKGFGDLGGLMKQAQKMQSDMKRLQAELRDRVVEGRAGGDAVIAYCADKLAGFKRPKAVIFVEQIPRNPSGKILKRILRQQFAQ